MPRCGFFRNWEFSKTVFKLSAVLFQNGVDDRLIAQFSTGFRLLCIGVYTGQDGLQTNDSETYLQCAGDGKRFLHFYAWHNADMLNIFSFTSIGSSRSNSITWKFCWQNLNMLRLHPKELQRIPINLWLGNAWLQLESVKMAILTTLSRSWRAGVQLTLNQWHIKHGTRLFKIYLCSLSGIYYMPPCMRKVQYSVLRAAFQKCRKCPFPAQYQLKLLSRSTD